MQQELYKSMVVAKQLGLISETNSRWDEPISKAEGIMLIVNANLAKDKINGYLSTVEYGNINLNKFNVAYSDPEVLGTTDQGMKYGAGWIQVPTSIVASDPVKKLSSGITLWDAKLVMVQTEKDLRNEGYTYNDIKSELIAEANDLGTTLDEISRLPSNYTPAPKQTPESQGASATKDTSNGGRTPLQPCTTMVTKDDSDATLFSGN